MQGPHAFCQAKAAWCLCRSGFDCFGLGISGLGCRPWGILGRGPRTLRFDFSVLRMPLMGSGFRCSVCPGMLLSAQGPSGKSTAGFEYGKSYRPIICMKSRRFVSRQIFNCLNSLTLNLNYTTWDSSCPKFRPAISTIPAFHALVRSSLCSSSSAEIGRGIAKPRNPKVLALAV